MDFKNFNELEALKLAINTERGGIKFYQQALDKVNDDKAKELLEKLIEEEKNHVRIFTDLYEKFSNFDDNYLFDPEYAPYFESLAKTNIFFGQGSLEDKLKSINNVMDVFAISIRAEKDSISFYEEMAHYTKDKDARQAFEALVAEEKTHIKDIKKLMADIITG
ncbi:MAG: ferritin family protein [Clostridia bacterium]|nr:ferritin family protein [Clostridia bacterium]